MTSKAERQRRKKQRQSDNVARFNALAGRPANDDAPAREILRPTAERMAQGGKWHQAAPGAPSVDITGGDMLGRLYAAGEIAKHHHDAGRDFQALLAAYHADMGLGSYRSCLDIGAGGYDATDGNAAIARRFAAMLLKIGTPRYLYLRTELDKPHDAKPASVEMLRRALEGLVR